MTYPTLRGYDAWKTREPDYEDPHLVKGVCPDCGEETVGVICQACGFDANDYPEERDPDDARDARRDEPEFYR